MTKRFLSAGIGLLGLLVLSACGEDTSAEVAEGGIEDIQEAALAEGSVTWYTDLPEAVVESTAQGFEEKYDIPVAHTRAVEGQLAQRFASEMDSGSVQADVMNVANEAFFEEANSNGWFAPLDEEEVASLSEWPDEHLYADAYALINIQPLGIAYNTETTDLQPKNWEDLDVAELSQQIIMTDPEITSYTQLFYHLNNTLGEEYLRSVGDLSPQITDSMVPGAQQLAAGEYSIMAPALASVVQPLIDEGAPLEIVFPDETTGVNQFAGVVEGAENPNSGRLFMSYLLSQEGQEKLANGLSASVLENVPGAMELPSDFVTISEDQALQNQEEILGLLGL